MGLVSARLLLLATLTGCVYEIGLVSDQGCDAAPETCDQTDDNCEGVVEICDDVDNDCDGLVDGQDDSLVGGNTWYDDADEDGAGGEEALVACGAPDGYTSASTDCDDTDATIHPEAGEVCNGADDDCDGLIDGQDDSLSGGTRYYADDDGDGFGDADVSRTACSSADGWVDNSSDCDDSDATIVRCGGSSIDDGTACTGSLGSDDGEVPTWTGICDESAGFTSYGSHCYFAVTSDTVWQDARASCAAAGGYLTTLADSAEEVFVFALVAGTYVGGCQEVEGGEFGWITGESMTYTDWGPTQPDDNGDEDCLELMSNGTGWNDIWCDANWDALGYVCEFEE